MYETLEAGPAAQAGALPTRSPETKRRDLTFLVSDIFGSTALNEVLGNTAWAKVLSMHDAIVRDAIWGFGGHEVKKTGDGFFAAFPASDKAVQCAIAIRDRFPLRPPGYEGIELRVGIGLSEGEAIELPRDYVGLAVTLAFRLAEHARAGEVLVTSGVRGSCRAEMVFSDLGLMPLRGFRAPAQLYRVEDGMRRLDGDGTAPGLNEAILADTGTCVTIPAAEGWGRPWAHSSRSSSSPSSSCSSWCSSGGPITGS